MFGFTEEQITTFCLPCGIGVLILFALFVAAELALKCKIGRMGGVVLVLVMTVSMSGFVVRAIAQQWLQR